MMADLSDLLLPELVLVNVVAASKKALFHQAAAAAAPVLAIEEAAVVRLLAAREKLGSTGFGGGIAIPHARVPGLPRIAGLVMRLTQPIDFQGVDDLPVDIAFILLSPPEAGAEHLKALARISRRLRDRGFVAKLRGAGSRDAVYALLTGDEARDAA
jgi:nitrogen PTS system EIIA component